MEKINIDELAELLNIPEFERIIYHKVEELKYVMADRIQFYRNLKKNFKKTAYGHMQIYESHKPVQHQTYRFEVNRMENGNWIPIVVEPALPLDSDLDEILPPSVIKYISSFEKNPETIHHHQGSFRTLSGSQNFQLEFTRYSDDHILGTIRKREQAEGKKPDHRDTKLSVVKLDFPDSQRRSEHSYAVLFRYMQVYPEIGDQLLSYFNYILKPLADGSDRIQTR